MSVDAEILPRLGRALEGRYEIVRELGRGGMATVYLANDPKHDREVAIKVLLPDLSATLGAERFEREIRLAAKLQHPHILGLFDSGIADGLLYYVMPFVKGESVRDRIDREGMLPIEDALQITLEVNDALGYAHKQGIVHRDIKPENILLSGGHALVADFGIARAVEEGTTQKLTQTGLSMGTAHYMAPEQAAGETVGPTADLYALGCVLYEMLAGQPPFNGKNSMQIMARHAMEQVPSIRVVRQIVPEEIEDAIFVVMNKAPADRPQNAEQFGQLLWMPMGNTSAMRTPTMTRRIPSGAQRTIAQMLPPKPWWKRTPALVAAGVVLLVAVAVGAWQFAGSRGPGGGGAALSADSRRLAVLYFTDLSKDSSLAPIADGLTEGLTRSLSSASSFSVVSTTGAAKFRGSTVGRDSIARALRAGYLVRGDIEPEGENVRVSVSLDDASGANLDRKSFTVPRASVVGAQDTLVTIVGDLIRRQIGLEFQVSQQRARASNPDSWLLLQRGEAARRNMESAGADTALLDRQYRTADSLYTAALAGDSKWADPEARRALIAYRRSRLARDANASRSWVGVGLEHANNALRLDPDNADALEVRGNLRYWSWLKNFEEDPAKKAALIDSAKADLEHATTVNTKQAGAYATLSHLLNNHPSGTSTDVLVAAQRAYEADEFLAEAEVVLSRLFLAAYDLGQFQKAEHWCGEAQRRFASGWRTPRCQLMLLTMNEKQPDVAAAWRLADSVATMAPDKNLYRLNSDMLVAMVLARASKSNPALADSARHVIKRSEGDATMDPTRDLALYGAMAATALGDKGEAVRLLKIHLAINPQKVEGFRTDPGWQYRDLVADPAYRALVGGK